MQNFIHQNSCMLIALLIISLSWKQLKFPLTRWVHLIILQKNIDQFHEHDTEWNKPEKLICLYGQLSYMAIVNGLKVATSTFEVEVLK